jgi:hypothetical protein
MMATTNEFLPGNENDLISASNAIDEMISMSIIDHEDPNSEKLILDQTNNTSRNWSPRYVFQNKIDQVFINCEYRI